MIRRAAMLPVALSALAAACVSVPRRSVEQLELQLPDRWQAQEMIDAGDPREWLAGFGDSRLERLVAEALEGNRDLRALAARVDAARAQERIAGADARPQISASTSGSRQRQNFIGFPIPGSTSRVISTTSSRTSLATEVSWEPDLWGRIRAGTMAAVADRQALEADIRGARLSLAAGIARAWFEAIEARRQVALSEATVVSYRTSNEAVERRYRAGVRPALDLRLLRAQLADAEALLAGQRVREEQALRRLEILLGRYPSGSIAPPAELLDAPQPIPAGLPLELIARRPDLVAAERRLAAADARLVGSRAALYPSLRLTGTGGAVSSELGDLLNGEFRVWSLLAGITQPLFRGGRLRAAVQVAEARTREALEQFAGAVLVACSEVETSLAVEQHLARREDALRETVRESSAARALAERQYRAGISDVLTVMEARRRALAAESQLLAVRRQRLDTRADLLLALGGGHVPAAPPIGSSAGPDRPDGSSS